MQVDKSKDDGNVMESLLKPGDKVYFFWEDETFENVGTIEFFFMSRMATTEKSLLGYCDSCRIVNLTGRIYFVVDPGKSCKLISRKMVNV